MSYGVPFFSWCNGKPAWIPSKELFKLGWRRRELKDGRGAYLPIDAALDEARDIDAKVGIPAERSARAAPPRPPESPSIAGYVYFLKVDRHIKIGFAKNPFSRAAGMLSGISGEVQAIGAVRGTMHDERMLHWRFEEYLVRGEWFVASKELSGFMSRCLTAGRIVALERKPNKKGNADRTCDAT